MTAAQVVRFIWHLPGWLLGGPLFVLGALCAALSCILVVLAALVMPPPNDERKRATGRIATAFFGLDGDRDD